MAGLLTKCRTRQVGWRAEHFDAQAQQQTCASESPLLPKVSYYDYVLCTQPVVSRDRQNTMLCVHACDRSDASLGEQNGLKLTERS